MKLEAKIALVTGAARGIGRAIAEEFARCGADLVVCDVREDLLGETEASIRDQGRRVLALGVDVTRIGDVHEMVRRAVDHYGRIDVCVNNAGIIEVRGFVDVDEAHWDAIMDVNAKGVFFCAQAVARQMIRQGSGRIINMASIAARKGIPDMAVYAASKAAVMSMTRSMSLALAPQGITVNALAPGVVDTDMWTLIDEQRAGQGGVAIGEPKRERIADVPLGRAAQPGDVASVAAFLASDAADYVTGQTINVDGGTVLS